MIDNERVAHWNQGHPKDGKTSLTKLKYAKTNFVEQKADRGSCTQIPWWW